MFRDAIALTRMFEGLRASDNVSYVLSKALTILRTNAAWDAFARQNGGDSLVSKETRHQCVLDVVPAPLRDFYVAGFARAAANDEQWIHDYECSSAETFRKFRMIVYPFNGTFVVTHALIVEHAHDREPREPGVTYEQEGVVTICAHCRRVRNRVVTDRWDWVPSYVLSPPRNLSHGLCVPCARYNYGDAAI